MIKKFCSVSVKSTRLLTCLSISTMCLLILTTIVIITVISITPIIVLGIAEMGGGQRDVILLPSNSGINALNSTQISQMSGEVAMPRIRQDIIMDAKYGVGWHMNFQLEKKHHCGTFPFVPQLKQSDHFIYVHQLYEFQQGQQIEVGTRSGDTLLALNYSISQRKPPNYLQMMNQINMVVWNQIKLSAKFKIAKIYDQAFGKLAVWHTSGTAYLNISSAYQHMIASTFYHMNSTKYLTEYIKSVDLGQFASEASINIPNRIQVYEESDYQKTYDTLNSFAQGIMNKIGLFSLQTRMPIADRLTDMKYLGMFIGVILKLIIICLFTLSILMMNNMLNVGIQRKNFDFAVLKTMGADRMFVIMSILVDSIKYVIISNCIAFPFAYFCMALLSEVFVAFIGYYYSVQPTLTAIIGGFFIGVLVPIASSITPIWGVINNDLAQNLNPIRNKTESIKTEVYMQGASFPVGKLIFGAMSAFFGLMIYYLLPKAMLNQDVGLLLFVFFSILVGLLLGLILISYSFQFLFEKAIAYITLFWANKTDFNLMMKNLSAHRIKNRKTSILYAISVALVIFVSVGISIQMQTISEELLKQHGTYLQIRSYSANLNRQYYDQLFATKFKDDIVDWAYQSQRLDHFMQRNPQIKNIMFSDKAKLYFKNLRMYGVSANFNKVMPRALEDLPIKSSYAYEPYDPYEFLYSPDGYMTCTMSQYMAKKFNLLNTQNRQFLMNLYQVGAVERRPLKVSTIFYKQAGLGYSQFSFGVHQMGISFDTYVQLGGLYTYNQIPLEKIKIQVVDSNDTHRLANKIRNELMTTTMDSVWDFSDTKITLDKVENLLDNVLLILLVLVLLISFFSLVTTSYINIINQKTQIAILMTLGYKKMRILRIYVYEAFVVVLNSCLIGVAVGTFVAWMMGLQRELFGDYPIGIQVKGLWVIGIAALVSSILSTLKPIRDIFSQSINQVFVSS